MPNWWKPFTSASKLLSVCCVYNSDAISWFQRPNANRDRVSALWGKFPPPLFLYFNLKKKNNFLPLDIVEVGRFVQKWIRPINMKWIIAVYLKKKPSKSPFTFKIIMLSRALKTNRQSNSGCLMVKQFFTKKKIPVWFTSKPIKIHWIITGSQIRT